MPPWTLEGPVLAPSVANLLKRFKLKADFTSNTCDWNLNARGLYCQPGVGLCDVDAFRAAEEGLIHLESSQMCFF